MIAKTAMTIAAAKMNVTANPIISPLNTKIAVVAVVAKNLLNVTAKNAAQKRL